MRKVAYMEDVRSCRNSIGSETRSPGIIRRDQNLGIIRMEEINDGSSQQRHIHNHNPPTEFPCRKSSKNHSLPNLYPACLSYLSNYIRSLLFLTTTLSSVPSSLPQNYYRTETSVKLKSGPKSKLLENPPPSLPLNRRKIKGGGTDDNQLLNHSQSRPQPTLKIVCSMYHSAILPYSVPVSVVLTLLLIVVPSTVVLAQPNYPGADDSFQNAGAGSHFSPQISEDEIAYSGLGPSAPGSDSQEGRIRLVGSRSAYAGNLEVYHLGRWGSICDDDWDQNDATVACRQLGFPAAVRATTDSEFGRASERYWLDNLNCQGNENFLYQCNSNGWGTHDCSVAEAAGVECVQNRARETARPRPQPPSRGSVSQGNSNDDDTFAHAPRRRIQDAIRDRSRMRVRLAGGRGSKEGRVEVDLEGNNRWGLICGDGWMLLEANVTCMQLGQGFARAAPQTHVFGGRAEDIVVNGISCRGTESDLSECDFKEIGTHDTTCPGGSNVASVVCGDALPDLVPDPELLQSTAYIEDRQMFFLRCAMEENCLAKSAYALDTNDHMWPYLTRRLLRFTSRIVNLGSADFRPHLPKYLWEWHSCHMHYHSMDVFSHYDLLDRSGRKVAQGHKASFCLEDNECQRYSTHKYRCQNFGDQGISIGCSDVYEHNIDCQWVDITDVDPGYYQFKVTVNPEFKVAEQSFSNNAIRCDLLYTGLYVTVDNCTLGAP